MIDYTCPFPGCPFEVHDTSYARVDEAVASHDEGAHGLPTFKKDT